MGSFTKLGVGHLDTNKHHAIAHIGMHELSAVLCMASVSLTDWEHVGTAASSGSALLLHGPSWSSCAMHAEQHISTEGGDPLSRRLVVASPAGVEGECNS